MIALLLASLLPARAQESAFTGEGRACGEYEVIMGTSALRNSALASETNANTYSAAAFAGRYLARIPQAVDKGDVYFRTVMDYNTTFGVARLPVYQGKALEEASGDSYCDPSYQLATRPYDLHASNFGFAVGGKSFTFLYATSFTYAGPAYGDQLYRFFLGEFVAAPYAMSLSMSAPLVDLVVPGKLSFLDYLIGGTASVGTFDLAGAVLGSKGAYFQASESLTGAYAFAALPSQRKPILQAGVDRLKPKNIPGFGMTSAAYQDIPFVQEEAVESEEDEAPLLYRLRVGNLQQQDIGGWVDFGARYRLNPDPEVSELAIGLHNPGFHVTREQEEAMSGSGGGFLIRGGYVTTPTAWAEGNGPERLLSARAELSLHASDESGGGAAKILVLYNDPDQLQLYPFARDALSYQIMFQGEI